MLELNTKKLKLKIDGKEFELTYPTVGQYSDYSEAVEKTESTKEQNELLFDFLVSLGLTRKVCEKLQSHMLMAILEELAGQKK